MKAVHVFNGVDSPDDGGSIGKFSMPCETELPPAYHRVSN